MWPVVSLTCPTGCPFVIVIMILWAVNLKLNNSVIKTQSKIDVYVIYLAAGSGWSNIQLNLK